MMICESIKNFTMKVNRFYERLDHHAFIPYNMKM